MTRDWTVTRCFVCDHLFTVPQPEVGLDVRCPHCTAGCVRIIDVEPGCYVRARESDEASVVGVPWAGAARGG